MGVRERKNVVTVEGAMAQVKAREGMGGFSRARARASFLLTT